MKITNKIYGLLLAFLIASVGGCGGSQGGTETGDTSPVDTLSFGARVQSVASALVPDIDQTDAAASVSTSQAISYGSSTTWDDYLLATNVTVLTDVFGDPDVEPRVITKIRVLVDQFATDVQGVLTDDPNMDCSGISALNEGDMIDIPFYGSVSNGSAGDRYFDCISEQSTVISEDGYSYESWTLYGRDEEGVLHIVQMSESTETNTTDVAERGNISHGLSVAHAVYAEVEETAGTAGYLDLQYAHAVIYSGDDDVVFTSDDVIFKARSRITGRAVIDESDVASVATGDFTVTKYDRGFNEDDSEWMIITKTAGRGSYGEGEHSLFNIDSDASSLEGDAGIFCLEHSVGSLPAHADGENCSALETAFAWGDVTLPISLLPALVEDFELKLFFEGDDVEMIANDGSNFDIPTYTSTPVDSGSDSSEEL